MNSLFLKCQLLYFPLHFVHAEMSVIQFPLIPKGFSDGLFHILEWHLMHHDIIRCETNFFKCNIASSDVAKFLMWLLLSSVTKIPTKQLNKQLLEKVVLLSNLHFLKVMTRYLNCVRNMNCFLAFWFVHTHQVAYTE